VSGCALTMLSLETLKREFECGRPDQEGWFIDTARGRAGFPGSSGITHSGKILGSPHMDSLAVEWDWSGRIFRQCDQGSYPRVSIYSFIKLQLPQHFLFSTMYKTACIIFPLQVRNKPHDRVCKCAFILGTVSMVANNRWFSWHSPFYSHKCDACDTIPLHLYNWFSHHCRLYSCISDSHDMLHEWFSWKCSLYTAATETIFKEKTPFTATYVNDSHDAITLAATYVILLTLSLKQLHKWFIWQSYLNDSRKNAPYTASYKNDFKHIIPFLYPTTKVILMAMSLIQLQQRLLWNWHLYSYISDCMSIFKDTISYKVT
jgi:hypothetical protein